MTLSIEPCRRRELFALFLRSWPAVAARFFGHPSDVAVLSEAVDDGGVSSAAGKLNAARTPRPDTPAPGRPTRQLATMPSNTHARCAPSLLPAKSMFRRSLATFWNSRSVGELSMDTSASSMNR